MRSRSAILAVSTVLCCVLAACHHDATRPEPPVPTTITLQPAGGSLDAIGATVQLSATVLDQRRQTMTNPSVTWTAADGGVASVSAAGLVTAVANGTSQVTAAAGNVQAQVTITVDQTASTITMVSGDQQTGDTGQPLAQPLVVQVNDRLDHPVAGVQVEFHAAAGSGTVTPASATTNASGQAQTIWTADGTAGVQHVRVVAASLDSISFSASVQSPGGTSGLLLVAPDTLVDSQTMTLTGLTFSTTPADNVVTVDGVSATVSAATATSLTVQMPSFGCRPARTVTVSVAVGTQAAVTATVPLRPAAFTTLAVGEEAIVQDPTQFCLQFASTASGTERYLIGLSAPAEIPGVVLPFQITAQTGASILAFTSPRVAIAAQPQPIVRHARVARSGGAARGPRPSLERGREQAEARLRRWEADRLPALAARSRSRMPIATDVRALTGGSTVPAVGDTLTIRVPDATSTDPCTVYTTIHAVVRVVGTAGVWVQDVDNPTTDSLTLADIQAASDQFDNIIYDTDTTYFGHPSDVDGNGHIVVVLTWQVNKTPKILGFVFGGDLFPGDATCPQSNGGELYYGQVPDPNNIAGTGARTKADVVAQMPDLIAHEFTHIIQNAQRAVLHTGVFMSGWAAEGQATFAEELVGDAVLGNTSAQNYGADVAFGAGGFDWYAAAIQKLMAYFGDLGVNSQAANAPDLCTVYGNLQLTTVPCDVAAFYGASWGLQRYIGDQYGPAYPGGLSQLTRDWISKNVSESGTANIAALLGVNYDTLFVHYATALALDDQANSTGTAWVPPQFSITSWNSSDLASFVQAQGFGWLAPAAMAFAPTSTSRSVRGGSTAYTVLTTTGAHPATAIHLADLSGHPLSTALRPALWIVRVE